MKSHSSEIALRQQVGRKEMVHASVQAEDLVFDRERARVVFGTLYHSFIAAQGTDITISVDAPQWKYCPTSIARGSLEHRVWLWSAAGTDLRAQSEDVYHTHQLLWENRRGGFGFSLSRSTRGLYSPDVLTWTPDDMTAALAKCGFGNPKRNVEWWQMKARTLWGLWGGDPFRMFDLGTVSAVMEWKMAQKQDPLPGIGPKIASLIAIFMEEIGMDPVPDAFPVDVHVQRIALALRVVRLKRIAPILNETLEALLRPAIVQLCAEEGWSRVILSHALWFRGNRGCTNCWKTPYVQIGCPVFSECQGVYSSRPYFKMGLWVPMAGPMAKGGCAPLVPFSDRPLFI